MFPTNFLLNVLDQINKACDYFLQSFVRSWRKDNVVNLVIVKSVVFNVGRRHLLSPLSHHQHKRPCLSRRCRPGKLFWGRELPILVVKQVFHKIYFYIIFLLMGRYSLTESPYILAQSRRWPSSGQLTVAAAGRGMKTCLCFLPVTGAAEMDVGDGGCWRHFDPATRPQRPQPRQSR